MAQARVKRGARPDHPLLPAWAGATFTGMEEAEGTVRAKRPAWVELDEAWDLMSRTAEQLLITRQLVADLDGRLAATLRLSALTRAVEKVADHLSDVIDAAEILYDDVPLAEGFPDGSPAPAVLTPRQVIHLAHRGPTGRPYPAARATAAESFGPLVAEAE